jgi:heme oxygenase (biliverdin-IX-beta and delta-forming)
LRAGHAACFAARARNRTTHLAFITPDRADYRRGAAVARWRLTWVPAEMLLDRLKIETRESHDRIEAALDLMRPDLSRRDYGQLLARYQAFFRVWEPSVGRALADDAFFAPRRKLHLLTRDLDALGVEPLRDEPRLKPFATRHEAMGSLYVLEGSTMGGLVIAGHVRRTLGVSGPGALYFENYGRDAAERWRAFREVLGALSSPQVNDAVVATALDTFAALHAWLAPQREAGHG